MLISELTEEECLGLIAGAHLARLACSKENQPYIVPINYVLEARHLYCFTTLGQKVLWMRANPLVCVAIDDIEHRRQWTSVIATGRYEELDGSPRAEVGRLHAWRLLQSRPNWWEPGYARTVVDGDEQQLAPVFFRIALYEITGRRGRVQATAPEASNGLMSRLARVVLRKEG